MDENTTLETTAFDTELDSFNADENENTNTDSFGKEIAKTLAISTAASAGTLVGFAVVGFTAAKVQEIRARRAEKKAAKLETEQTIKDNIKTMTMTD